MLRTIGDRISYSGWCSERYKRLDKLDRLLNGTFYDHLPTPFTQEMDGNRYNPLSNRRPSVLFRFPMMVARQTARKLFAGRHRPKIIHPDTVLQDKIRQLAAEIRLEYRMSQIVYWGSVGSVGTTFRIPDQQERPRKVAMDIWRAKWLNPVFDEYGDLMELEIFYETSGSALRAVRFTDDCLGKPIDKTQQYYFVRRYTDCLEITYKPIPVRKVKVREIYDNLVENTSYGHDLGFVPAHWFANLPGGEPPDGDCTWEAAIPMAIEMDYILSAVGCGVRYNSSPQVVTQGDILNFEDDFSEEGTSLIRGPAHLLQFDSDRKDPEGNVIGGGDAKLLEMTGNASKAGIDYVEALRKLALEQISAARKDPERLHGVLSGSAMMMIDAEFMDLVQEHRTAYGEYGMLPLLKKMARTATMCKHPTMVGIDEKDIDGIALQWPRLEQMSPQEIQLIVHGMVEGVGGGLIDIDKARNYLDVHLDLPFATGDSPLPVSVGAGGEGDGPAGVPLETEGEGSGDVDPLATAPRGSYGGSATVN